MHFSNLCTSCGQCLDSCKNGAVIVENGKIGRNFSSCANCDECVSICPTSAATMSGSIYSVEDVMEAVLKDAAFYMTSEGGVTFSGGEYIMQGEFLLECLDAFADTALHCAIDTCGQTAPDIFKQVLEKADLLLFDIKHTNSEAHKQLVGVDNKLILQNLQTALENAPEKLCIRVPLMPGLNDGQENIDAIASLLLPYGISIVDVLPCHAFGKTKYDALNLPRPEINPYQPEALQSAWDRFVKAGLEVEIV